MAPPPPRAAILVEGPSDQRALEALAERRGRHLAAEGVSIVPIGGAQGIGNSLQRFGPRGLNLRLAGLCDAAEEDHFRRALERDGPTLLPSPATNLSRADMERRGFYVCDADLEDELVRSLGAAAVEQVVDAQGDLRSFRTLQHQPAWRGMTTEAQLCRFLGTRRGRKIQYARLLAEALDLTTCPARWTAFLRTSDAARRDPVPNAHAQSRRHATHPPMSTLHCPLSTAIPPLCAISRSYKGHH